MPINVFLGNLKPRRFKFASTGPVAYHSILFPLSRYRKPPLKLKKNRLEHFKRDRQATHKNNRPDLSPVGAVSTPKPTATVTGSEQM